MDKENKLKERCKKFALSILRLADTVPNTISGRAISSQLIRAATSVGANYRAACRGRSKADFIAKLGIVLEEADECDYWLELLVDARLIKKEDAHLCRIEADELTAIMTANIKTARMNK